MRRKRRRLHPIHDEPIAKQRPIERLSVERDDAAALLDPLTQPVEHRRLSPELGEEELLDAERFVLEPCNADEERDCTCATRETCRLGIEEERPPKIDGLERWIERELRQPLGTHLECIGDGGTPVMMARLEVLIDEVKRAEIGFARGPWNRTTNRRYVELSRRGLLQTL